MNRDIKNIVMLYENVTHQPAQLITRYGDSIWRINDKLHREDGPAVEWANGTKEWYMHDKQHREDGPAVEWVNGDKAWYLNNIRYEDIFAWAEALLKLKGINNPSEDEINNKVQQVTSSSILD